MKKILFTLLVGISFYGAHAQTSTATAPQLTKEEKAKMKAQQEADLSASFKEAGIKDDAVVKAREILIDAQKKSNELKANTALSDTDKDVEKKKINDEKNAKLKELMGEDYKVWTTIRKKQKEAMVKTDAK